MLIRSLLARRSCVRASPRVAPNVRLGARSFVTRENELTHVTTASDELRTVYDISGVAFPVPDVDAIRARVFNTPQWETLHNLAKLNDPNDLSDVPDPSFLEPDAMMRTLGGLGVEKADIDETVGESYKVLSEIVSSVRQAKKVLLNSSSLRTLNPNFPAYKVVPEEKPDPNVIAQHVSPVHQDIVKLLKEENVEQATAEFYRIIREGPNNADEKHKLEMFYKNLPSVIEMAVKRHGEAYRQEITDSFHSQLAAIKANRDPTQEILDEPLALYKKTVDQILQALPSEDDLLVQIRELRSQMDVLVHEAQNWEQVTMDHVLTRHPHWQVNLANIYNYGIWEPPGTDRRDDDHH